MLKIDNSLLEELGLAGLPDAEKNSLLKHIYETLEMRVGMRLADQMTNEQLDEFEQYFEAKDDAGAFKWLETNFPNYKDIVQEEFDKLKVEVGQSAPQILSASQTAQAQVPPGTPSPAAPQQTAPDPSAAFSAAPQAETPSSPNAGFDPVPTVPPTATETAAPTASDDDNWSPSPTPSPQPPQPMQPAVGPAGPYVPQAPTAIPPSSLSEPAAAAPTPTPAPNPYTQPDYPAQQPPAGPGA